MSALSVAFLILAIVGHLVLVRASLGYGYSFGLRHRGFLLMILGHALVGIAGPAMILSLVGFNGPKVLRGGDWSNVALPWMIYLFACAVSVPVGALVIAWRAWHAVPDVLRSNDVKTHDAVAELGRVPAPHGTLAGRVVRLPGNECFRLDVTTLQVTIPRLPAMLDGLTIIHLTDLHFAGTPDRGFYEWAMDLCAAERPDLIGLSGDIADKLELLDWLATTLGKLDAPLGRYFILGNHDVDAGAAPIREAMEKIGWTWVGQRCAVTVRGEHHIVIGGHEGPWGTRPPECDVAEFEHAALRVALCHAPHEVRWARANRFDLTLAGHLHGGQIRFPFVGPIIGGRLACGLFHLRPTVLHVGRGLGELAPLRYGCRPEVTKLVLRAAPAHALAV